MYLINAAACAHTYTYTRARVVVTSSKFISKNISRLVHKSNDCVYTLHTFLDLNLYSKFAPAVELFNYNFTNI
jgi:hypothetical protein